MREFNTNREISVLYRYSQRYFGHRIRENGLDLDLGTMPFLCASYRSPGITQEALSVQIGMDKGTTAKALKKLEADGYIRREEDEEDGRVRHVFVTEKAEALLPGLFAIIEEYHQILYGGLDDSEIELLNRLLVRMKRNIQRRPEQQDGCPPPPDRRNKDQGEVF